MVFTHLSELSSPTWNTHFPTSEKIHESPFRHYLCLCVWHFHYCVCVVCFPQGKIIICHRCNRYVHKFSLFFLFLSFSSSSICCIYFYLCSSSFYSPTCRIRSLVFCPGRQFQMATFFPFQTIDRRQWMRFALLFLLFVHSSRCSSLVRPLWLFWWCFSNGFNL